MPGPGGFFPTLAEQFPPALTSLGRNSQTVLGVRVRRAILARLLRRCGAHWTIGPGAYVIGPSRISVGDVRNIMIADNVWLAANVVVLGGVCLLEGTVVAAGAVVRPGTYGPNALLVGNPAEPHAVDG